MTWEKDKDQELEIERYGLWSVEKTKYGQESGVR